MKSSIVKRTLLGFAAVTAFAVPAVAGDWNYGHGGLKGLRGTSVPVPAPEPAPVYAPKWYFRADAGVSLGNNPGVTQTGHTYGFSPNNGLYDTPSGETFGLGGEHFTSFFTNKEFDTRATYGIGVGYYWSKHFRTDITLGVSSQATVEMGGTYHYDEFAPDASDPCCRNPTGRQVDGTVVDKTDVTTGTLMFNAYYDIRNYGRFKPYIGAGLGLAVHEASRSYSSTETVCTPDHLTRECLASGYQTRDSQTVRSKGYTVGVAASLTAGLVYDFNSYTSLDLNYRYLYTGSADVGITVRGHRSTLEIDDQHQHQLRAGLRFNIN